MLNTTLSNTEYCASRHGIGRSLRSRVTRWACTPVLVLGALLASSQTVSGQIHSHKVKPPPQQIGTPTVYSPYEIDWDYVHRVHAYICNAGIREPKIVMAQAILETGWFRSSSLMSRNNLFGFRHVRYLTFDRVEESIDYYKTWQDTYLSSSDTNYFNFLERIRYGAPGYSRHVRKIEWNEECPAR